MEYIINTALQALLPLLIAAGVTAPGVASAQRTFTPEFTALVVHVDDGDTLVALRADGQKTKVRLANIDAPEKEHGRCKPGQPFSEKSSLALKQLVQGKTVSFACTTLDRFDRHICDVQTGSTTANRELVRQGLAWANRSQPSYLRDQEVVEAEMQAKSSNRGIWSDPRSVEPWIWRREAWNKTCQG